MNCEINKKNVLNLTIKIVLFRSGFKRINQNTKQDCCLNFITSRYDR